jgi:poly-gamma-glutamate synthesis protein (capsule biosynthesis protein)
LLVVSYHWGTEYHEQPTDRQKRVGHAAIDAGADVVLGHHSHVLEGIEFYHGHPILYSMGNFIFDQPQGIKMETALFRLQYTEGQGWTVQVVPLHLPASRLGPQHPSPEKRDAILHRFAGYCQALGTHTRTEQGRLIVEASAPPATDSLSTPRQETTHATVTSR